MLFVFVSVYDSVWMHCSSTLNPLLCILNKTCVKQRLPSCRRKNELSVCLASGIYRPAVTLIRHKQSFIYSELI